MKAPVLLFVLDVIDDLLDRFIIHHIHHTFINVKRLRIRFSWLMSS